MREIKFRAWDKQTNNWLRFKDETTEWYNPKTGEFRSFFDKHVCLMQYTGLKDKNGKEIYEGDIVTGWFNNQKIVGQVFYGSNAAFFIQRKELLGISLINADVWVEVIGNIYENPELLNA